ncbi:MAG: response regulator [Methanospirillum sp.]|uniref:response regulator n=1 Tax=Methanospirillum sp. TaxID=45200 RepID=UPI00236E3632|nr:response regulator [Methanospirillum sp.]MDD1729313.1 response regulator [Methanospirillum sp.]
MTKPIRVLYVDDDLSFLEIVKVILEKDGNFLVSISPAGDAALKLLDQGEYDIVLSDCRMVRMDGIRFREKVRDMYPEMPFIFFTGREKGERISRLLDRSTFYLQKSGDPEVQFARLTDLIISCLPHDTC